MNWKQISALALILTVGHARADLILGTDFTGVATLSWPTATGISWATNGVTLASPDLTFTGELSDGSGPYDVTFFAAKGTPQDNIQVHANIGNQGPWSTSFTITPQAPISLADFNLGYRAIDNNANEQGPSRSALYTLVITQGATSLGSFSDTVTDPGGGTAAGDTAHIDLSGLATLSAGSAYTFTLTVSSASEALGNNVAIDDLALNGSIAAVPEPTGLGVVGSLFALALAFKRTRRHAK